MKTYRAAGYCYLLTTYYSYNGLVITVRHSHGLLEVPKVVIVHDTVHIPKFKSVLVTMDLEYYLHKQLLDINHFIASFIYFNLSL